MKTVNQNTNEAAVASNENFLDKIRKRFAIFDAHHKMEQFCIIFLLLLAVLIGCFVRAFQIHDYNQQLHLSDTAVYTSESYFSLTQDRVRVLKAYRNEDYTKSFILLQVDGFKNLPSYANGYRMILSAGRGSKITGNPKGAIYIFGNSGYIGLGFTNSSGFSNALYNIMFQNTDIVASAITPDAEGQSFDEMYNICNLAVNLRGKSAEIAGFLEKENPTIEEIYSEVILKLKTEDLMESLNTDLININNDMSRINAIRKRLSEYNISVPALPAFIANDMVTTDVKLTEYNPNCFDTSMLSDSSFIISTDYNVTVDTIDESNQQKYVASDNLYLVTNYVYPGGFQFNYQDLSLTNGILEKLLPPDMDYRTWLNSKTEESRLYSAEVVYRKPTAWYYSDGTLFDSTYNTPEITAISDEIDEYNNTISSLYESKKDYQTSRLLSFVELEIEARSVSDMFSVYASDKTLIMY